jgi:hypothetical protein
VLIVIDIHGLVDAKSYKYIHSQLTLCWYHHQVIWGTCCGKWKMKDDKTPWSPCYSFIEPLLLKINYNK